MTSSVPSPVIPERQFKAELINLSFTRPVILDKPKLELVTLFTVVYAQCISAVNFRILRTLMR